MSSSLVSSPMLSLPEAGVENKLSYNELSCLRDAVEAYTELLLRSGSSAVRLHCSVPTWNPQSDLCLDMHDLNDLRTRSLVFIHDLVNSLRSSGISATYSLAPAHSPLCLVCASSPEFNASQIKTCALSVLQNAKLDTREHVLLADLERCPSLIII